MNSRYVGALVLAAVFLGTGCYAHNHILPTELPRLNGMSSTSTRRGNVMVVTQTVQDVTRTDGTIVQIQGEFSATVVPRDRSQPSVEFSHPVRSSVDDLNLTVAGGNRAATNFPLDQIDYVDISTPDNGLNILLASLLIPILGAATAATTILIIQ